ncbi:ABC transporter permease [Macrococcoides canis]|uniref:ABC transporter permease n=1 Tax=Macrococcoides canis TaxID=1855823 RepID=UPI001B8C20A4|nr:ABC transporter permease [Macrococcus canis]UTH02569.1 ABC transporter permease [Macrococcus canis]UTH06974.1 ABC transporter permease [Macrococcus canis]
MNLALKEIKYYKVKYLLIAAIIFLLSFLVLFVSSLAQGLGKDNVSFIEQMDASHYVISKDADNNLMNTPLSKHDQKVLEDNNIPLLKLQPVKVQQNEKFLLATVSEDYMKLPSENKVNLDSHTSKVFTVGDKLNVKDKDTDLTISTFTRHQMFAHMPVGLVSQETYDNYFKDMPANAGILKSMSKADINTLNDELDDSKLITPDKAMKGIPSYEAEQMPLNLMVIFLFLISAIVITVFFYVITIQKTTEYGILKAIGTSNRKLIFKLMQEVILIVMVSVLLSIGVIYIINMNLPATMPFFLNPNLIILLIGLFLLVALIGVLLSIYKVLKIDPIQAIGGE